MNEIVYVLFLVNYSSLSISDSVSSLELLSDSSNLHQYDSQFLSFPTYIYILLKTLEDNIFYLL